MQFITLVIFLFSSAHLGFIRAYAARNQSRPFRVESLSMFSFFGGYIQYFTIFTFLIYNYVFLTSCHTLSPRIIYAICRAYLMNFKFLLQQQFSIFFLNF